eukprot:Gb_14936 [translate_table: standard]
MQTKRFYVGSAMRTSMEPISWPLDISEAFSVADATDLLTTKFRSSRCVSTLKSEICSKERSYERSYVIAGLGEELRRWYGRKKEKIEGVWRRWCKRLDVTGPSCVVAMAMRVMEKALINTCTLLVRKHTLRIYMVASLFLAAALAKSRVRISEAIVLVEDCNKGSRCSLISDLVGSRCPTPSAFSS